MCKILLNGNVIVDLESKSGGMRIYWMFICVWFHANNMFSIKNDDV